MDFFEDLGRKISDTADTIGKKTEEVVERQRLKNQIQAVERTMSMGYISLGEQVFAKYEQGETVPEEYWAACEELQNKKSILKQYKKELAEMNGAKECEYCNAVIAEDAVFCSKCGNKVEQ